MKTKQILFQLTEEDKEKIRRASKLIGVGLATFSRLASLEKTEDVFKKFESYNHQEPEKNFPRAPRDLLASDKLNESNKTENVRIE